MWCMAVDHQCRPAGGWRVRENGTTETSRTNKQKTALHTGDVGKLLKGNFWNQSTFFHLGTKGRRFGFFLPRRAAISNCTHLNFFIFFPFWFCPLATDVCCRARRTMKSLWTKPEAALMNTRLGPLIAFAWFDVRQSQGGSSVWSGGGPVWSVFVRARALERWPVKWQLGRASGRLASLGTVCMSSHQQPGTIKSSVRRDAGEARCVCAFACRKTHTKKPLTMYTPEFVRKAHSGLSTEGLAWVCTLYTAAAVNQSAGGNDRTTAAFKLIKMNAALRGETKPCAN